MQVTVCRDDTGARKLRGFLQDFAFYTLLSLPPIPC